MAAAVAADSAVLIFPPNSTPRVEATLSFAINPVMSAVHMRQSPMPSGLNIGAIQPAMIASILSEESLTRLRCRSKLCRNHTTIVARKITVNALCKKSFAFSHKSCSTFFAPGKR